MWNSHCNRALLALGTREDYSLRDSMRKQVLQSRILLAVLLLSSLAVSSVLAQTAPLPGLTPDQSSRSSAPVGSIAPLPQEPAAKDVPAEKESHAVKESPTAKENSAIKESPAQKENSPAKEHPTAKENSSTTQNQTARENPGSKQSSPPGDKAPALSKPVESSSNKETKTATIKTTKEQTPAQENSEQTTLLVEPKNLPESSQLIALPFLVDGESSTLSIIDSQSKPIEDATVGVDQELFKSSKNGSVTFKVPHADSFEISLYTEGRRKLLKRKYVRRANVYAENEQTADFVSALLKSADTKYGAPQLVYSPAVVTPGTAVLLLGKNFSEKIADDLVNIDGSDAPILASSPEAIIAMVPEKLSAGPSRELFVSSRGLSSNVADVDLATVFFTYEKTQAKPDEDDVALIEKGKVGIKGSGIPCLIRVKNLDPDSATLFSPSQEPLWKNNILLTPGGEQNFLSITLRKLVSSVEPKVELRIENALSPAGKLLEAPQLQSAACRAEIFLLARKKNAAELKLDELRKNASADTSANSNTAAESGGSDESRVLSMKLLRISRMLAVRKFIYNAMGNSEDDYRKTLDDAAGGALKVLEQASACVQVISDPVIASTAGENSSPKAGKKGRPLRMLEPPIRLLPPMSPTELASMNSSNNSQAGSSQASNNSSGTSGTSDEPQLRPSLPEPEPEVSATSRAKIGGNASLVAEPKAKPKEPESAKPTNKSEPKTAPKKNLNSEKSAKSIKAGKEKSSGRKKSKSSDSTAAKTASSSSKRKHKQTAVVSPTRKSKYRSRSSRR